MLQDEISFVESKKLENEKTILEKAWCLDQQWLNGNMMAEYDY